ncbi:MAG: hypothetical protein IT383_05790 [Deltaproteobacteria bacterium]|nr:hypothetical protein [Deltaproteobacteria bacterium]
MADAITTDVLWPWTTLTAVFLVLLGPAAGIPVLARVVVPREQRAADALERAGSLVALALTALAIAVAALAARAPSDLVAALFTVDDLTSPGALGAKLLVLELVLAGLHLALVGKQRGAARVVGLLLAANSVALAVVPGALLARAWPSILSNTPGAALLMLSSALLVGGAAKLALTHLVPGVIEGDSRFPERATRVMIAVVVAELIATVAFSQVPRFDRSPHTFALWRLYGGTGAPVFWPFVVVIGILVPGVALWFRAKTKSAALIIAAAATVGACAVRWLLFTQR